MENKIMFLIIMIFLVYVLFSANGINGLKKLLGNFGVTSEVNFDTSAGTTTGTNYSGGGDSNSDGISGVATLRG